MADSVHDTYVFRGVTYTREAFWYLEAPMRGETFTPEQRLRLRALRGRLHLPDRRKSDERTMTK
jgi:hypothetical protein